MIPECSDKLWEYALGRWLIRHKYESRDIVRRFDMVLDRFQWEGHQQSVQSSKAKAFVVAKTD